MKSFKDYLKENSEDSLIFHKGMKNPPSHINNIELKSWTPPGDWKTVSGQDHSIKEPEMKVPEGKKAASGLIMHEPDGRIWLMKPTNSFGGYKHTFPKGRIEKGLHPQANAIKEAFEETGLKGRITGHAGDAEGDTSVTRYYHAIRETGNPLDHDKAETEAVALVHPRNFHKFLNKSRDIEFSKKHLGMP